MDPVWPGYITKGVADGQFFELDQFDQFTVFLGRFKVGDKIEVILRKQKKKSSDKQRRYYWKVICGDVAKHHSGEDSQVTKDQIHDHFRQKFLSVPNDLGLLLVRSTESLTTVEREEYHEKIRNWCLVVWGYKIPLPNEVDWDTDEHGVKELI